MSNKRQLSTKIRNLPSYCNKQKRRSKETYIGLTKNEFKERFNVHKSTFKNVSKRYSTKLSKHVWNLKDKNIDFEINWTILRKSKPYSSKSRKCHLCLLEKYYIICKPEFETLNKRNELASSCRHNAQHSTSQKADTALTRNPTPPCCT